MNSTLSLGLALLGAACIVACRGDVYIGVGDDGDDRPDVSLAVSPTRAAPGQALQLVAAASDDYRVDRVRFYRFSGSGSVLLGTDTTEPYQLLTSVPGGASGTLEFYARATDGAGQSRDSDSVTVEIDR